MGFTATIPLGKRDRTPHSRVRGSRNLEPCRESSRPPEHPQPREEPLCTIIISGSYVGEQYDHDLGLYFLRARYMDTTRGRFWSMDGYEGARHDPASLHKYLYAHANPVSYVDPSGTITLTESMIVSGVANMVGTAIGYGYSHVVGNPWRVDEFVWRMVASGSWGVLTGGAAFKAGMLVKVVWPWFASATIAGIGSGVNQLMTELMDFYVFRHPVTFHDACGRVLRATASGIVLGGILTGIEQISSSASGYYIKSLPPAAEVLPFGEAAAIATAGGVAGYGITAATGQPILELILSRLIHC